MIKRYTISVVFVLLGFSMCNLMYAQQLEYKEGEMLIKFDHNIVAEMVFSETRFTEMNFTIKRHFPHLGVYHVSFETPGQSDHEVMSIVRNDSRIIAAQFNHRVYQRSNEPNDEYFSIQWNFNNTGQTGGTAGADISAIDAWNISTGSDGLTSLGDEIILSVIDSGFDLNHEDLNFTTNMYNAYVDSEDPNDMPVTEHGTRVAGVAGSIGNNEDGVAGVVWNNRILPVAGSSIFESTVVSAYDYVLGLRKNYNSTNGQDGKYIVATNSSFGRDFADPIDFPIWCQSYDSLGVHGILNIAATMNRDEDVDQVGDVPTACPSDYLISVTNTDHNDDRFQYAAYGATTIELGAPGTDIVTTTTFNRYTTGTDGNPDPVTGTSYATPHVTGTVGLIYSILSTDQLYQYNLDPSQAALDVKSIILNSVDQISALQNITVTGGRLNIYEALRYTIENHGATLGIEKPLVTLPLYENMDLHEDVYLASGSSLTIEARDNPVTLTSNSGSVTIGKPATGTTQAKPLAGGGDDSGGDVDEIGSETPQKITLSANYPNPFNPVTTIRYELPVNSNVRLEVFDILGRRVAVLVDGMIEAGIHEAAFDASTLASGVYLYRLSTADFVQTRQMVLVK